MEPGIRPHRVKNPGDATTKICRQSICICVFTLCAATIAGADDLIAIDVLLQPGRKMVSLSEQLNARMREQTPGGFELDEEHAPHITLIQRFVAESDLPRVLAAVEEVKSRWAVDELTMTATGIYHIPSGAIGLAGIGVEPSGQLIRLQNAVLAAVNPYARSGGGEAAFVPDRSGTPFDPFLFTYVDAFVPERTGDNFKPHVTIGMAPLDWLEDLERQPFEKFSFGATGIAVYQLGNFGTASKRLDTGN